MSDLGTLKWIAEELENDNIALMIASESTLRVMNPTLSMQGDWEGIDIYRAAVIAILHARIDGQESGKHSPESWMGETIGTQFLHTIDHVYNQLDIDGRLPEVRDFKFDIKEAEHALCRLAIAIALYKRENK